MQYTKGQHLIVVHAGGETGFVLGANEIFNPVLAIGDCHGHINGGNFEKWYNKIILNLPTDSIIVMDNASYHSVQTDRTPTTATPKADIQVRSSIWYNYMLCVGCQWFFSHFHVCFSYSTGSRLEIIYWNKLEGP